MYQPIKGTPINSFYGCSFYYQLYRITSPASPLEVWAIKIRSISFSRVSAIHLEVGGCHYDQGILREANTRISQN